MQRPPKGNPSGKVTKADDTGVITLTSASVANTLLSSASNSNIVLTANNAASWWTTLSSTGTVVSTEMDEIRERLRAIEERLTILRPNLELHEKFPALRCAYEDYLILEKLINGKRDKDNS